MKKLSVTKKTAAMSPIPMNPTSPMTPAPADARFTESALRLIVSKNPVGSLLGCCVSAIWRSCLSFRFFFGIFFGDAPLHVADARLVDRPVEHGRSHCESQGDEDDDRRHRRDPDASPPPDVGVGQRRVQV